MGPASALTAAKSIQGALGVLAALNYTAHLFSPIAPISEIRNQKFDMIVVGGGTAGCLLAARLSEVEDFNVLVIEAGGIPGLEAVVPALVPFAQDTPADYNFTSQPDGFVPVLHKNQEYHLTQGKMISGTDGMNFMMYIRGEPEDYNSWAKISGDDTWTYENVLPYFKKTVKLFSEPILDSPYGQYHGTTGNMKIKKMNNEIVEKYFLPIQQLGHERVLDTNGAWTRGFTQPLVTAAEGNRQSSAFAYLAPAKNRANLHIFDNAKVTKIIFDDTKRATGVEVLQKNGETFTIEARKEIIVSAGSINSAKLLMLSGIGPKAELHKLGIKIVADLPVGENFQDHIMSPILFKGLKTDSPIPPQDPGEVPVAMINGFVSLNKSQPYADYEVVLMVNPHDSPALTQLCTFMFKYVDEVCQKIANASEGRELLFTFIDYLLPLSRGRVSLKSKNAEEDPLIFPGYYSNNEDLISHASYVKDFSNLVNTDYMKSIDSEIVDISGCSEEYVFTSDEFWQCYVTKTAQTVWHFSSTCSMGSVVDSRLRVYGVEGLRIADASVMPYITRGNTAVPVYMIAEKAADFIKEENGAHTS